MNTEKEAQLFRVVVENNLARIAERMNLQFPQASIGARQGHLNQCLSIAWDNREDFDPAVEAWITWFGRILDRRMETTWRDGNAGFLSALFAGEVGAPKRTKQAKVHAPEFGATGTPLNLNALPRGAQDCPPCWRCRYFDGWLPADEDEVEASSAAALDPEIAESCLRIDRNKVRVANWVRGMGWANLEDDPE